MVAIASVFAAAIFFLLILTATVSVRESAVNASFTFRHYVELYTDSLAYTALLNTVGFALITLAVAMLFGVPIAWLVERTDLRARSLVY
ncbi:MAG TPA: hypothetical protein VKU60_08995 [Chloroflexota bacterium]|nr:hypothetical protein [Chloroflexota bacterium]